jgi:hypothetical protein
VVQQIPTPALTDDLLPAQGQRLRPTPSFYPAGLFAVAAAIMIVLSISTWIQHLFSPTEPTRLEGTRFLIDAIESLVGSLAVWVMSTELRSLYARKRQKR